MVTKRTDELEQGDRVLIDKWVYRVGSVVPVQCDDTALLVMWAVHPLGSQATATVEKDYEWQMGREIDALAMTKLLTMRARLHLEIKGLTSKINTLRLLQRAGITGARTRKAALVDLNDFIAEHGGPEDRQAAPPTPEAASTAPSTTAPVTTELGTLS